MKSNYINEWFDVMTKAKKMLEAKDFVAYNALMEDAKSVVNDYKKDCDLTYECTNFGMSNFIFEDALPRLFKENKTAVKEFVKTIKEDKNLTSQFNFIKALEKRDSSLDAKEYLNESISLATNNIDFSTIKESNRKLAKLITKYGIKPSDFINDKKLSLYEACDYVLTHKKKLSNLNEHNKNFNTILVYSESNYNNNIDEGKVNLDSLVEDFNRKYMNLLNEEEKSFVKEIMDFKAPQNDMKKEKLFNKFKNECITTVDKLLEGASDDEKDSLENIKEQIKSKQYCSETVVADLAKLLEIRDILLSD